MPHLLNVEDKREMIQFWSGWIKGVWVEEEEEEGGRGESYRYFFLLSNLLELPNKFCQCCKLNQCEEEGVLSGEELIIAVVFELLLSLSLKRGRRLFSVVCLLFFSITIICV